MHLEKVFLFTVALISVFLISEFFYGILKSRPYVLLVLLAATYIQRLHINLDDVENELQTSSGGENHIPHIPKVLV